LASGKYSAYLDIYSSNRKGEQWK